MEAAREISQQDNHVETNLNQLVETSGDVNLPADFWNEFHSSVGGTGDIHENHKLLEQITLVVLITHTLSQLFQKIPTLR